MGNVGELWSSRRGEEVYEKRGSTGLGDLKFKPGGVDRNDDEDIVDGLSEATEAVCLKVFCI